MSLQIRNTFVKNVAKNAPLFNAFFALIALQPFEAVIDHATIIYDLKIQLLLVPGLISLLMPIGIRKQMRLKNEPLVSWDKKSFNSVFTSLMPKNKYIAVPVWTLISAIFVTIPFAIMLDILNISQMTGLSYFAIKMAQSWVFCVFISYLIITHAVTDHS